MLLARSLGKTLRELGQSMGLDEFMLWIREYNRSPWGEERADLRSAIVAATNANIHRGKNTTAFKVGDFMPKFGAKLLPKMTPKDQAIFNDHMARLHNKIISKRDRSG